MSYARARDMPLTTKFRQQLRGLAHHLDPVVLVGHGGLTEAVLAQIDEALAAHELIKVRLGSEAPVERDAASTEIATSAHAEVVQTIGRVLVFFRRRPNKPKVGITPRPEPKRPSKRGSKGAHPARARAQAKKRAARHRS